MSSAIKNLFQKYGKTAVAVHFTVYFATFGGCYMAVEHGRMDMEGLMVKYGLLRERQPHDSSDSEDERQGWLSSVLAGKGSSAAVAFLCTKALMPIRAGITLTATPLLHRVVTGRAAAHAASIADKQKR